MVDIFEIEKTDILEKEVNNKTKDNNINSNNIIRKYILNKDDELRIECLAAIIAASFFICKAVWYIYYSGIFLEYKINIVNLETIGDNAIFKTIIGIAFVGLLILSNFICYEIVKGKSNKKVFYILHENVMVSIGFGIAMWINGNFADSTIDFVSIIVSFGILLFFSFFINSYGIIFGIIDNHDLKMKEKKTRYKKTSKSKKGKINKTSTDASYKNIKRDVVSIIAFIIMLQVVMIFGFGIYDARRKDTFNTVQDEYVVLYENEDNYFLAKCDIDGENITKIYFEEKKVISKIDVVTKKRKLIIEEDD